MGKHAAELDLKSDEGRKKFEELLEDADVLVDGYRPGALEKLGYGPDALAKLAEKRGKGVVYVNENCFGYSGEWADRPGWQQIADCVCFFFSILTLSFLHAIFNFIIRLTISTTGQRSSMGPRRVHGSQRTHGPSLSHFRLRNRLHGRHRRTKRPLPPHYQRRLMAREGLPYAI
jgi:hypothetical protein